MKKEKFLIALFVLLFSCPILKAQTDSLKTLTLDEVVITATKFPKSLSETGKVLTIIDAEQLSRSEGKDLSQLLNDQVGLSINGANSNPGKDKAVYLRGAKSEYTLFLIDGIPVNDPSGPGGAFDPRLLPLNQFERIEILKGSQSTLYGSDAIAGVINLITKKGNNRLISVMGTLTYGSYNTFTGNGRASGSLGMADYHLGYSYAKTDGISEAEDINNSGTFDKDGFARHSIDAGVDFKILKGFTISPFVRTTQYEGKFDGGPFVDDNSTYTSKLINPGFQSKYKLRKGVVNLMYAHNATDRKYDSPFGIFQYKGRFDHADVFINQELNSQIQMVGGLNYQNLKMLDESLSTPNPNVQLISPYLSFYVKPAVGLSVELGGRYNIHSKYGNNFTYSFNPAYILGKNTKLFINQSTGFKAPTLSQLYGLFGANENLKPEVSRSFEAGFQHIFNQQVEIRFSFFDRIVNDVIVYTFPNGNINQDEQHDNGLEIESIFNLSDKVTLRANYAFVDGKVTAKEAGIDTTYYNLFRRPKHSFGVNLNYQVTSKFFLSFNMRTNSKREDLYFNPQNFFATEVVTLDAFTLLDAYFSYAFFENKLVWFVDLKNILNQDYREAYGYNVMGFNVNSGINFKL